MNKNNKATDAIFITGMVIAWASYYIASKSGLLIINSPFVVGMFLRLAAFVFLTIHITIKKKWKLMFSQGKTAILLLLIGVLGYCLDTFANIGLQYGSVGTGTVLLKTDILMATIVSVVFLKERLRPLEWLATVIMFVGVLFVINIDFNNMDFNPYDLFFIASAASVTANAFLIKGVQAKYKTDTDIIAYYNNFVVLVLFTLSSLISKDYEAIPTIEIDWKVILTVVGGGLAQTLTYIFYYRNLKHHPVWRVKLYLLLIPIISCIFGALVWNEEFTIKNILGIVAILIGALIIVLTSNKKGSKYDDIEYVRE